MFRGGGYISNVNTSLGFRKNDGGGAKIVVDSEEMFNLETTNSVWRGILSGRIKQRHTIDFDLFNLNRTAKSFIGLEIPVGESDSLKVGELVETTYELFFTKLTYNFSFYQNDKVDLAAGIGLHLLSTGLKFQVDDNVIGGNSRLNLPLPVLSSRFSFAPREWLHFMMTTSYLYVEFDAFKGALLESSLLCDIRLWKYVGAGLGYSSIRFDGGAVTGELFSEMNVGFNGVVFYLSAYF